MRTYKDLAIWETVDRIDTLIKYRSLIHEYFENVDRSNFRPIENARASQVRSELNILNTKVHQAINGAGVSSSIFYSPAPAFGGVSGHIDLIANIFILHEMQIQPRLLVDILEKAIGVYEHDRWAAIIRTFNPFYWLSRTIKMIVSLPFVFLGHAGFNQSKIEESALGRFIKAMFYLITVLAAFLTVLNYLGCLSLFKNLIRIQ